jgi:hypothetical protein
MRPSRPVVAASAVVATGRLATVVHVFVVGE